MPANTAFKNENEKYSNYLFSLINNITSCGYTWACFFPLNPISIYSFLTTFFSKRYYYHCKISRKIWFPFLSFSWPIIIANPLTNKAEVAFKIEIFLLCFLLVGGGGRWGGLFCHLVLWKVGLDVHVTSGRWIQLFGPVYWQNFACYTNQSVL